MIDADGNIVKSVFESMTLDEISAVDRPAQPHARATILKRVHEGDDDDDEDDSKGKKPKGKKLFGKRAILTTATNGHTHTLVDESGPGARTMVGETSFIMDSDGMHHSHPWVRDPDTGNFTIGEANGHTHNTLLDHRSLDVAISLEKAKAGVPDPTEASKSNSGVSTADSVGTVQQGTNMSEKNDQTVDEAVVKQLDELTKRAERAEKVAELNDAQRSIFSALDSVGQDDFLALPTDLRDAEVAKAAEANAVVYTDAEGTEYRKSDDQRMVSLAKRADAERDLRVKGEEIAKAADLAKRAEGFSHIVGGTVAAALILKGIDALSEADQGPALEALTKQEAAMAEAFVRKGTSEVPSGDDNALEVIAKAVLAKDPTLSPEQAMAKALETPEGEAAYSKSLGF